MNPKKVGAEAILAVIITPLVAWIITSIIELKSTYAQEQVKIDSNKDDIQEIKSDVKYIRNYLLEKK
jgi:mannitol-specific phosphotransferase system IIBC component